MLFCCCYSRQWRGRKVPNPRPRALCRKSLGKKSPRSSVWERRSHPQTSRPRRLRKMFPRAVRLCFPETSSVHPSRFPFLLQCRYPVPPRLINWSSFALDLKSEKIQISVYSMYSMFAFLPLIHTRLCRRLRWSLRFFQGKQIFPFDPLKFPQIPWKCF